MSTAAHDLLRESGDACIINISMTLHYGATWYQAHASAAKAAIDSLTRSLALEWGRFGIRVLGIAPGPIANTPGMAKLSPGLSAQAAQAIPLGRMGSTWDVAMTAVFFCTAGAGYVTGDTLVVDGGEWLAKPALAPPEAISKLSRAAEAKSRALGPGASSARSRL
jgi:peroxisomal 2,4-dienoyl-CoA reductase